MFYINYTGRCGNQFFQYAFFRKIQIMISDNSTPVFNFYNVMRWQKKTGDDTFNDCLKFFNVIKYKTICVECNEIKEYGSKKQKKIYSHYKFYYKLSEKLRLSFFARYYHKKMQKNGIYYEDCYFDFFCLPKTKNIFVKGYFEKYKYYDGMEEILKNELKPKLPLSSVSIFGNNIKLVNSVCVSIRVWNEILDNKNLLKTRDVCTKEYYQNAINKINKETNNAIFIVFSNDLEWVKENIDFNNCCVLYEPKNLTISEKVSLMTSCKHFILSTSTFSWWIQYLGKDYDSMIVSPNKWYADKESFLIRDEWIKIPV